MSRSDGTLPPRLADDACDRSRREGFPILASGAWGGSMLVR